MPNGKQAKVTLSKEEWLQHSLQALASRGFTALKADKLAKSLGVSRGSFYWHFRDLKDFHFQVLETCKAMMVDAVIAELEGAELSAESRLEQLVTIATTSDHSLSLALRAWGFNSPDVLPYVQEVDKICLGYVVSLLEAMDFSKEVAQVKGRIIYAGYVGHTMLGVQITKKQEKLLVADLLKVAKNG